MGNNQAILKTVAETLLAQAGYLPILLHTSDARKHAVEINPAGQLEHHECMQILATAASLTEMVDEVHSVRDCLHHAAELFFEQREEIQEAAFEQRRADAAAEAKQAVKSLIQDITLKLAELEDAAGIAAQGGAYV